MTLESIQTWATVVGLGSPVLAAAALWWLSSKFAPKSSFEDLQRKVDEAAERLQQGETRFALMDAAVKNAGQAAETAQEASQKALEAAEDVLRVQISIEKLNGRIEALNATLGRLERDNEALVRGHLSFKGGQA